MDLWQGAQGELGWAWRARAARRRRARGTGGDHASRVGNLLWMQREFCDRFSRIARGETLAGRLQESFREVMR
jgi:hypothetical protein